VLALTADGTSEVMAQVHTFKLTSASTGLPTGSCLSPRLRSFYAKSMAVRWYRRKPRINDQFLAERFEADRAHLQSVAYRMLGSMSDADDAVQETWLRLSRADASGVENLTGSLTTVVAGVSLDMLRARTSRREEL
jgi:sigma-70-like protein